MELSLPLTLMEDSFAVKNPALKVLRLTRHRMGHFEDVLLSQSFGLLLKKLYPTQQKQATQE